MANATFDAIKIGIATPEMIAEKVGRLLKADGIEAQVIACDLNSVEDYLEGAAAFVTIVREQEEREIPLIDGMAFLTGLGQDEAYEKLKGALL